MYRLILLQMTGLLYSKMRASVRNTKKELLDSAELLFALHGIGNVSVRMITAGAKANLSALGFHFVSRENVIREVFLRRLMPISEQRRKNLYELRALASICTADVWHAFLDPVLELSQSSVEGERAFLKILSRTLVDESPQYSKILTNELAGLLEGYLEAFQRSRPDLSRREVANRVEFGLGALARAVTIPPDEGAFSLSVMRSHLQKTIPQVFAFIVAGFDAPAASPQPRGKTSSP
jgi:AcrR family transcriptional regulator